MGFRMHANAIFIYCKITFAITLLLWKWFVYVIATSHDHYTEKRAKT